MIINIQTLQYPLHVKEVLQVNPNVSLPRNPTDKHLTPLGYANVAPVPKPDGDVVTEGVPEQHADGTWHQTWKVRNYTAEEAQVALDKAKQQAVRRINRNYDEAMNALVTEYPEKERESWGKQEREARDWLADNTKATPFMDAMLVARTDLTKTQLANLIITKSDTLADATGQLTGKRHIKEAEIEAAYTANDRTTLDSIVWQEDV